MNTMVNDKPLMDPEHFLLLAGEDNLRDQREKIAALMANGLSLPQAQERERSGVLGIHLVRSIYGWSVRYASGLQGFALIRSAPRSSQAAGRSPEDEMADFIAARDYARQWVAAHKGYAYVSMYDLNRYGLSRESAV